MRLSVELIVQDLVYRSVRHLSCLCRLPALPEPTSGRCGVSSIPRRLPGALRLASSRLPDALRLASPRLPAETLRQSFGGAESA